MTAKLHKLISTAVLGVALCASSLPVWAGTVYAPEVVVGPTYAEGTMAGARYSADSTQYIGCTFSNTTGPYVLCNAMDKTGKSLFCVTSEARYLTAVKAMADFSHTTFGVPAGSAFCSFLQVANSSYNLK
jgi:hypothetical protein